MPFRWSKIRWEQARPDDQKRQQKGLDYAEVKIVSDLLRVEREESKAGLAKELEERFRRLCTDTVERGLGFLMEALGHLSLIFI